MLEFLKQALHQLYDVQGLIQWGGVMLVCAIAALWPDFAVPEEPA